MGIEMPSPYVHWLQNKKPPTPVFYEAGIYWQVYSKALIPATIKPLFIEPSPAALRSLLRQSGQPLIRYTSNPKTSPSVWWYIVCDHYDKSVLTSKMRNQIKRGHRNYYVKPVDCLWLAQNAYPCYVAAASRYTNVLPASEREFRNHLLSMEGGPLDHFGVFSLKGLLVGYAILMREDDDVGIINLKFIPAHLKEYSSYALFDVLLSHYVSHLGFRVNNGNPPVIHNTNIHDYLIKFGFKRWYGRLQVRYQPWLSWLTRIVYPFRKLIRHLPFSHCQKRLIPFLHQEELRRQSCYYSEARNFG
jgi:hypothetical protein